MSDDEDNGPPTEAEEREWRKMELQKKRGERLGFQFGGVPTSLKHDDWLRVKRREKRAKQKRRADSTAEGASSSMTNIGYFDEQSDPESNFSDASTETITRFNIVQKSMEGLGLPSQEPYPTKQNINIHSQNKDQWFGLIAVIDSGTEENWISEDVKDRCDLKVVRGNLLRCATFNGQEFETDEVVTVTWRKEGVKKTEQAKFHIGRNAPFDVVFGSNIVKDAPQLFRDIPKDPTLVLTQKDPKKSEKTIIEQNRADHKARSQALAEKAREKNKSRDKTAIDNNTMAKSSKHKK